MRFVPVKSPEQQAALSMHRMFDTAMVIPGTNIRFGLEALLRLWSGIGDAAASALSMYLLYEATRLGVPRLLLARMLMNVVIEGTLGAIPIVGDKKCNETEVEVCRNLRVCRHLISVIAARQRIRARRCGCGHGASMHRAGRPPTALITLVDVKDNEIHTLVGTTMVDARDTLGR